MKALIYTSASFPYAVYSCLGKDTQKTLNAVCVKNVQPILPFPD